MLARQTIVRSAALVSLTAGIVVFAAQSGLLSSAGRAQTAPVVTDAALSVRTPDMTPSAPTLPRVADAPDVRLPEQITEPQPLGQTAPQSLSALGLPCDVTVTADAMPAAMVALDVMAPCQPDARVEISHAGLTIAAATDALGLLTLDIPGFETPAFFTVSLPDGTAETVLVGLPDIADHDRVAIAWEGSASLDLHGMDPGADFGGPGHIWRETPGSVADAITGMGGFLVTIGDASVSQPRQAQVLTFPRVSLGAGDAMRISVDVPITAATCGQPVSASSLEVVAGEPSDVTPIRLTLPGCEAVGDYLVLQNLFRDLTVASN